MLPIDLLRVVGGVCERLAIPYIVTGSVASTYYGEYRSTRDIDLVIDLAAWHLPEFCRAFPIPEWSIDEATAHQAIQTSTMFNILHLPSGLKADLVPYSDTPFNASRMHRARRVHLPGGGIAMFASPEDVILKKLEFFREGKSEKHLRDIVGMLKVSGPDIDLGYLATWVPRLGVSHEWSLIRHRVGLG